MQLSCEAVPAPRPGVAQLELCGELNCGTFPALIAHLVAAERGEPGLVVLDLHNLTGIDAVGLRSLLDAARRAHVHRRRFAVTRAGYEIRRTLRLTSLDQAIEVLPG
jgi:anti-anti-sigma factor